MYFGLPANDVCSNVLLFIDNVEKLKVACCKKLTSRTMWKTQEVGIESFVCNDLRPSELYRASTIDHPNSTVHRPSTIRTLPCIDHRPSELYRASTIDHRVSKNVHRTSNFQVPYFFGLRRTVPKWNHVRKVGPLVKTKNVRIWPSGRTTFFASKHNF